MIIRAETVGDYAAIADIHARAFDHRTTEPLIVTLLRQRRAFDPELSLVADIDGRIVGHALFSPYTMRLLGEDVRAVNLAPIGVDPDYQRQGIGGRLIEEGHRIAAAKGYALSFLLGHSTYYPRFGYHTRAYGVSTVTVPTANLHAEPLDERAPTPDDVPALRALWRQAEAGVDFALDPGPDFLDWLSPNPAIQSLVYQRGAEIVGYTRIHTAEPTHPRIFLAADPAAGRAVTATIAHHAPDAHELILPLHPTSAAAPAFPSPTVRVLEAAMAVPLGPSRFDEYHTLIERGDRPAGRVIWPVAFDL